jgi:type VI secretion system protein ImpJ
MKSLNDRPNHRVIWSEGQLLSSQHLQQQERHVFDQMARVQRHLHAQAFGWSRVQVDSEALQRGQFALSQATGILPDGTAFDLATHEHLPEAFTLSAQHVGAVVCLALALNGVNFSQPADEPAWSSYTRAAPLRQPARFKAYERTLEDDTDPNASHEHVLLGRLCPRLCLDSELTTFEISLPVARIASGSAARTYTLDQDFVPPLLDLRAHPGMVTEVEAVIALMSHRLQWQIERLNQPQTSAVLETTDFLLVQSLLRHEAALRLELGINPVCPLAVLRCLTALTADLAACNYPPTRPELVWRWDPSEPACSLRPALAFAKRSLSRMRERLALEIILDSAVDGSYVGAQLLPDLGSDARIVIAVQAQVPNDWLWQRFADQAIVCASDRLRDLVRLQMPGVALSHLPTAPAELPLQMGWHYFELIKEGQAWAELVQLPRLGLYVAGQWPGLALRGWLIQSRTGQREGA